MKTIVLSFLLCAITFLHAQQAGLPDSTFHADGKLATTMPQNNGTAKSLAIQADGKIIVGGYSNNGSNNDFTIVRYHADGSLDSSFNSTGILQTDFNGEDDFAQAIAVKTSGEKIILGGYTFTGAGFDFAVAGYNADGTPDSNFGAAGKVITSLGATSFGNAIAMQDDGKIILAGYSLQSTNEFALVRYNTDGTLDSTFDGDGKVLTQVGMGASIGRCITIQPDGKIVVAGETANDSTFRWEIALARYNTDGSPDSTFHGDGKLTGTNGNIDNFAYSVGFQSDGKIVLAGYSGTSPSNNNFLLLRYHTDGRIDSTFGPNGFLSIPFSPQNNQAFSLLIQPDDKMLAGGLAMVNGVNNFALARFDADGNPDNTFGAGGKVTTSIGSNDGIYALTYDADWKIVAAGTAFHGSGFDFAVTRYLNDFVPNTGVPLFDDYNLTLFPNPVNDAATLHFTLEKEESLTIELLDINGKTLHTFAHNEKMKAGMHSAQLSFPHVVPAGAYFILVSSASGKAVVKVVKQ